MVNAAAASIHSISSSQVLADAPRSACARSSRVLRLSLSAQQLAESIDESVRPRVTDLRAFLRAHDTMFSQVRRGGYELGLRYYLPGVA